MVIIRECTESGSSSQIESEGEKSLCMVGSSSMELCLVSLPLKEAIIEDYASSGSSSGIKVIDEPFWDVECSSGSDRSCVALYSNRNFDELEHANMDNRSLLLMMDFSEDLVDLALSQLGDNASPMELIDLMLATPPSGYSRETGSAYRSYREDHKIEESTTEALATTDKTFCLREMGFNEDEIASAIDTFGSEIPISELADSIFAGRMARVPWEDNEDSLKSRDENVTGDQEGLISSSRPTKRHSYHYPGVSRESNDSSLKDIKGKKPRVMADECRAARRPSNDRVKGKTVKLGNSSGCKPSQHNRAKGPPWGAGLPPKLRKESPSSAVSTKNTSHLLAKLPYFCYGNVVDISSETWRRLSQFLYGIEPEMVNCKSFSALDRKEGYFHNLPTAERFYILLRPSNRYAVYAGVQDMSPADPDQAEHVMGYPLHHTATGGMSPAARLRKLHYSFQTDTIGYHLSALKQMYPLGINVLSIFSGVGGAEIALSRLGIHLKCVVSVEASEACRRIMRRWWHESGQSGELVEAGGIQDLTLRKLEGIVERVGRFDVVIGLSQVCGASAEGDAIGKSAMDMQLFFEFVRLLQLVRSLQGRNET